MLILEHEPLIFCSGKFPLCQFLQSYFHLSSIRFSVSGFVLKSLIHLGLSFEQGDEYEFICILLHADSQVDQHHLLKILSSDHSVVLVFFNNQVSAGMWVNFMFFDFITLINLSVSESIS